MYWIFIKDPVLLFSSLSKEKKGASYASSFFIEKCSYITYLLLFPVLFGKQTFVVVLLGFLMMHAIQSLFLLCTFFITHHVENTQYPEIRDKVIQCSWLQNQIISSNDFHPFSKWANVIFGGFNSHIAHHIFPNISHVYYDKLNSIIYAVLHENGIQANRTTYFGGIRSHLRHLRILGVRKDLK
jgi:linoleoyl-CoA desaturase